MERRRGIPLVALVIFVALLVAIILTCTIILGANKNDKPQQTGNETTTNKTNETATPSEEPKEENVTLETEDQINSSSDVRETYKLAGNGKTFAKYAIYSSGGFDVTKNNLSNNLKLKIAMAQVTNSDMDKESTTKSVSKSKVEAYANEIFSSTDDIEYKDFTLYSSDTNFTEEYKTIGYIYDADKDTYALQENEIEEDTPSQITEVVTKAVKEDGKLEIYVKPIFVRTFYSTEVNGMGCELFADYDFQEKEYKDSFIAIAYSDYNDILKSEYNKDVDGYKYSELNNVEKIDLNKCKDYKYTFVKENGAYKLQSFEEVK